MFNNKKNKSDIDLRHLLKNNKILFDENRFIEKQKNLICNILFLADVLLEESKWKM